MVCPQEHPPGEFQLRLPTPHKTASLVSRNKLSSQEERVFSLTAINGWTRPFKSCPTPSRCVCSSVPLGILSFYQKIHAPPRGWRWVPVCALCGTKLFMRCSSERLPSFPIYM